MKKKKMNIILKKPQKMVITLKKPGKSGPINPYRAAKRAKK